jgi:hypothetical protein
MPSLNSDEEFQNVMRCIDDGKRQRSADWELELERILVDELEKDFGAWAGADLDDATMHSHAIAFKEWRQWCAEIGVTDRPARPGIVAEYLAERLSKGETAASLELSRAAIRHAHLLKGFADTTSSLLIDAVLFQRKQKTRRRPSRIPKGAKAPRDHLTPAERDELLHYRRQLMSIQAHALGQTGAV